MNLNGPVHAKGQRPISRQKKTLFFYHETIRRGKTTDNRADCVVSEKQPLLQLIHSLKNLSKMRILNRAPFVEIYTKPLLNKMH